MANIMRLSGGKTQTKVKKLGQWNISNYKGTATFDVKSKYSDYAKLTINNFMFPLVKVGHYYSGNGETGTLNKSYNPSTGILTFKFSIQTGQTSSNYIGLVLDVLIVEGEVELV